MRFYFIIAVIFSISSWKESRAQQEERPLKIKEDSLQAILPVNSNLSGFPMLEFVLRNKKINKGIKISSKYRRNLLFLLKRDKKILLKKPKSLYVLHSYYNHLMKYMYSLENSLYKYDNSKKSSDDLSQKLEKIRKKIKKVGLKLLKYSKDKKDKKETAVDLALISFLKKRNKSLGLLRKINLHGLSKNMKQRIKIALSYFDLYSKDLKLKNKAYSEINDLLSSKSRRVSLLSHLVLARFKVGLDLKGKKISKTDPSYKENIKLVSLLCKRLSIKEKKNVFDLISGIWLNDDMFNQNWYDQPFKNSCFNDLDTYFAIEERTALVDISKNNLEKARDKYIKLVERYELYKYKKFFDERLVLISSMLNKNKDYSKEFQALLLSLLDQYQVKKFRKTLLKQHYELVYNEILKAKNIKNFNSIKRIKNLVSNFLKVSVKPSRKKIVLSELANLYEQGKNYNQAKKIIASLIRNEDNKLKKIELIKKQIYLQNKYSNIPISIAWDEDFFSNNAGVQKIIKLYYDLYYLGKDYTWKIVRNLGRLEFASGRWRKTFFLWKNAVNKYPEHSDSPKSLRFLLDFFKQMELWDHLEEVSYLALKNNITLEKIKGSLTVDESLELALYQGSMDKMKSSEYDKARLKLSILEESSQKSKNYSLYLFLLSESLQALGQYEESIRVNKSIVSLGETSPYYDLAVLSTINIYIGRAEEEKSIPFFDILLTSDTSHKFFQKYRLKLAHIYLGLSKYEKSRLELKKTDLSLLATESFPLYFDLLFKSIRNIKDIEILEKESLQLIGDKRVSTHIFRSCYILLLNNYLENNDTKKIQKLSSLVEKLDRNDSIKEGYRYFLKSIKSKQSFLVSFEKINDLLINKKDRLELFIRKEISSFKSLEELFCGKNINYYCIDFNYNLLSFITNVQEITSDFSIETSEGSQDKKSKKSFAKIKIILKDTLNKTQTRLSSIMNKFPSNPHMVRNNLWRMSYDWNFSSGFDSGIGYFQIGNRF